jgi:CubicO group peptidase (beta-lactamase class C family)
VAGLAEAFERIGTFAEQRLPLMHAAGMALAVTDGDDVLGVVVRGFADAASGTPVRPETRFQIGSISKSFAAIVAMQEVEAGRLDLHAPLTELIPWLELPQPFGPITMHHLLSHTSGLAIGTEEVLEAPSAVWNLRYRTAGFAPGERFWYSNDGYKLVGLVLERVTGTPIHELIAGRILEPLGMGHTVAAITNEVRLDQATGYRTLFDDRPPHRDHPLVEATWIVGNTADGSIVSDVVDMCSYARMLLKRGEGLLGDASFGELIRPVIADLEQPGVSYGYGLFVREGSDAIWHSGGMPGFTALLEVRPGSGLGVVVLLNGDGDRRSVAEFALTAVGAAIDGGPLPVAVAPPDPASTVDAQDFAGTYRGDDRTIELLAAGDRLVIRDAGQELVLERAEGDAFLVPHPVLGRFHLRFGRAEDGRVVEAFHGGDWFRGAGYAGPDPAEVPETWRGYTGHYRGAGLWEPSFRVVIRKGALIKTSPNAETGEAELELVPLEDGSFRVGSEAWRPDRLRFEDIADGRALRAVYEGTSWYRTFDD